MALDHPTRVERVAVLDVLPTDTVWKHADARFALNYWPWSLLAQPEPLPERILVNAAEAIVDNALGSWSSPFTVFPAEIRKAYVEALLDPSHAQSICEEYRAAPTVDCEHDKADRELRRRITCPLLVLWSAEGPLGTWYVEESDHWHSGKPWVTTFENSRLMQVIFFPEEVPEQAAELLGCFFGSAEVAQVK